jgi:hypothetical protein
MVALPKAVAKLALRFPPNLRWLSCLMLVRYRPATQQGSVQAERFSHWIVVSAVSPQSTGVRLRDGYGLSRSQRRPLPGGEAKVLACPFADRG